MPLFLQINLSFLVAVEAQADVGTFLLKDAEKFFLELRIERKLTILCLVETALRKGGDCLKTHSGQNVS